MRTLLFILFICVNFCSLLEAQFAPRGSYSDLVEKAEGFMYENIDSALFYANTALKKSEANPVDSKQVFECQRLIGLIFEENNRLPEAIKAYQIALDIAENQLPDTEKFKIYTDWAIIHKKVGQYKIAFEYHLKTIERATLVNNWEMVENGYHGLGTMYSMMSAFDQSIRMYHKSIEAAEKWHNTEGVVLSNQNISNIYLKAQNNEMARKHIEDTYQMAKKLGDSLRLAAVLKIYGKIEMASGNYTEALSKNDLAKTIFEKKGDKPKLAESYLTIAEIHVAKENYAEAEQVFKKCESLKSYFSPYLFADFYSKLGYFYKNIHKTKEAIEALNMSLTRADSLSFKEIARMNHLALADIFNASKKYEEAYLHIISANKLSEVLFEDAKQKTMTEAQFKFDIQQRDAQIEEQGKNLRHSFLIRTILTLALLVVVIILFFTWKQMKAKQKAQQHAELLMKELHHRVKNNLQTVTSIMRLQARHISDPSVSAVLAESHSRLEAISMIHQQLYRTDNVQSINFKLFLEDLFEKLCFTHTFNNKPLTYTIDIENDYMDVDVALPLGLIINELLTNSFKYAYPSVEKPKVSVFIDKNQLYYADNGMGLPADFQLDKSKSFGVHLITSMAQQLKGKYAFGNDNGMYFRMVIQ